MTTRNWSTSPNNQTNCLQEREEKISPNIQWDDLVAAATVLPEFAQDGKDEIEYYLGYLPAQQVTMPFEPFLRALIQQFRSGTLSLDEYNRLSEDHIKLIRNEECKYNSVDDYDATLYYQYERDYLPYGPIARQRIVDILGYEPNLTTSLFAEMYLRKIMSMDIVVMPTDEMISLDFKLIGLVRYRQALKTQGKDAADNWPVLRNDRFCD
ncbi:hypothetical protein MUK70_18960 [Dyadobacter chenwenxiniae]|uniref:Uncharacterized protein n=1 Tax=Dyadobacter chenwenxiniae TaxID=2906456 RepID=A0A9X1PII3_9BACT|nr:hypothetical protein [Dyadobacter chenwenxiniae]MCF0061321.1 hypothetical protein [Dyadobacter chenwenxiniae]UON81143.1 hypothetical protein MUK70_18960 [Dyadobacter chenwenxiniae]